MNYSKLSQKVFNALKKNGGICKVVRTLEETFNEETCEYEKTEKIIEGYAVQNTFNLANVNGTTIQAGDVNLMCSLSEKPLPTDKIEFGETEYSIVSIAPFNPDGSTDIFYNIQAR